jgi:NAD(P)-dependent dehydrogenase (short-subunit alcohol dehydrogenase family)
MRFERKVAVVTGSGQGIGEAYAKRLAAEGAAVVVADLNEAQGRRVAEEISTMGGKAMFVRVDIADEGSTRSMAESVKARFGGTDLLINNAAVFSGLRLEPLLTIDLEYYMRLMAVNIHGALLVARALVPQMIERGGGAIVNQSSTAAYIPSAVGAYYGISKLALNGLTMSLATELGPKNIRVNGVAPGATRTDAMLGVNSGAITDWMIAQTPLGRIATTDEQADAALFLLSDAAAFIVA